MSAKPAPREGELGDYLLSLWEGKWLIFSLVGGALLLTVVVVWALPRRYEARALVVALPRMSERLSERAQLEVQAGALSLQQVSPLLGTFSAGAYQQLARADGLLQEVLQAAADPDAAPVPVEVFKRHLRVEAVPRARAQDPLLLTLTVEGSDPPRLSRLANAWARALAQRMDQFVQGTLGQYERFIEAQLQEAQRQLEAQEGDRRRYQRQHPLLQLKSEFQGLQRRYESQLEGEEPSPELGPRLQQRAAQLAEVQQELARLDWQVGLLRERVATLLARQQEARLAVAEPFSSLRLLESAIVPTAPRHSPLALYLALAAVVGLLLGLFAVSLRAQLRPPRAAGAEEER